MKSKRVVALLLGALMFTLPVISAKAAIDPRVIYTETEGEEETTKVVSWVTIEVGTAEELVEISKKATTDTWSQNKIIVLTADIDLANTEFEPIPSLGGTFDGQGHKISGLVFDDNRSYCGFISRTQPSAVVKNLTVDAVITSGKKQMVVGGIVADNYGNIENCIFEGEITGNDYIGGVCGYNESSGVITSCKSYGAILGKHYTGGIVGMNEGQVIRCSNNAAVNTTNEDKAKTLDDINLDQYLSALLDIANDTSQNKSIDTANNVIDTGGIAGVSTGIIEFSSNQGSIGYNHVGYNVGGIVGRQSGYVHLCTNSGTVLGRKDVGGIAGQAEPYVSLDLSQDMVNQLTVNINELHDLVNQALNDTDASSDVISDRLKLIQQFTDKAIVDADYIADETIDFTNGTVKTANDGIDRVDYAVDEAAKEGGILDNVSAGTQDISSANENLGKVSEDADIYNYMTDEEKVRYDNAKNNINAKTEAYNKVYQDEYNALYYFYICKYKDETDTTTYGYATHEGDLQPFDKDGNQIAWPSPGASYTISDKRDFREVASVKHVNGGTITPFPDQNGGNQQTWDDELSERAANQAGLEVQEEAEKSYKRTEFNPTANGKSYSQDVQGDSTTMAVIVAAHQKEMTEASAADMEAAINDLQSATNNYQKAVDQTNAVAKNLSAREDMHIPTLSDGYKAHTNSFMNNLAGMSENMGYLNDEMNNASGTLVDDLVKVNDQFSTIMILFTDALDGALDMDYTSKFEDDSYDVAEICTDGTVANCTNNGTVNGDLDVSGIAGAMGIEYDFDLESKVTGGQNSKANSTYRTKCVLRNNVNQGRITALKSYSGGVAGTQEIGTVLDCENYGRIISSSGDYAGGIAGYSIGYIRSSFTKAVISGVKYVGGIAGMGHSIENCYAMPNIVDTESFYGAIAGEVDDNPVLSGNYFFSNDLAGVDRINYEGMAESISYEEIKASTETPQNFDTFTITFTIDDVVVGTRNVDYMGSLPEEEFPNPSVEGTYYIKWDQLKIEDVDRDFEVVGESSRFLSTISSKQLRNDIQSVLLVDGKFKASQELLVTESIGDTPTQFYNASEHWKVVIPEDGNEEHQFRYQLQDDAKSATIWVQSDGGNYSKVKLSEMGKYKLFTVAGNNVDIIVINHKNGSWVYPVAGGSIVALLVVGYILISKKYGFKGKPKKKVKKNKKTDNQKIEDSDYDDTLTEKE